MYTAQWDGSVSGQIYSVEIDNLSPTSFSDIAWITLLFKWRGGAPLTKKNSTPLHLKNGKHGLQLVL